MNFLRRILRRKATPPLQSPSQQKNETPPLARLPAEILTEITTFLPLHSSALLAMTCKTILEKLGPVHFSRISPGKPAPGYKFAFDENLTHIQAERQEFLRLLAREMPSMIFCFFCKTIHDPLKTNDGQNFEQNCTFALEFKLLDFRGFAMSDCSYSRRHMLMKRHRLGIDITAELQHFQRNSISLWLGSTFLRQYTTRIVEGKFMIRTQNWILLPPGKEVHYLNRGHKIHFWTICGHVGTETYERRSTPSLRELLQCRLDHPNRPCDTCRGLKQCTICFTEYQINSVFLDHERLAFVVTSWRDLGEIPTPFELEFRCLGRYLYMMPGYYKDQVKFAPGSLKDAFEGKGIFLFDAQLTA